MYKLGDNHRFCFWQTPLLSTFRNTNRQQYLRVFPSTSTWKKLDGRRVTQWVSFQWVFFGLWLAHGSTKSVVRISALVRGDVLL